MCFIPLTFFSPVQSHSRETSGECLAQRRMKSTLMRSLPWDTEAISCTSYIGNWDREETTPEQFAFPVRSAQVELCSSSFIVRTENFHSLGRIRLPASYNGGQQRADRQFAGITRYSDPRRRYPQWHCYLQQYCRPYFIKHGLHENLQLIVLIQIFRYLQSSCSS